MASSDELLVDTRRITIGASGTLHLDIEELNLVFAPRPKRISLVSLTSPVRVTGTIAAPEVAVTVFTAQADGSGGHRGAGGSGQSGVSDLHLQSDRIATGQSLCRCGRGSHGNERHAK